MVVGQLMAHGSVLNQELAICSRPERDSHGACSQSAVTKAGPICEPRLTVQLKR